MPVISIRSLPFEKNIDIPFILLKINENASIATGIEVNHIWSYWDFIKSGHYASGSDIADFTGSSKHSPIVEVISFEGKPKDSVEALLTSIAETISTETGIDIGNIFITYREVRSGEVFDGGEIVRKK